MFQTTVTIGRNIGTDPMRARDWERFANSASRALAYTHMTPRDVEVHTGTGSWTDADGVTSFEDSRHLTIRHDEPLTTGQTGSLTNILASLAKTYGQDAIALATGPVILVTPSRY